MATVIRMRRGGRTHKPYYRIVVQDSSARSRGRELDTLGVYQPCARPQPISEVDAHKALEWLRKGAQPSDTARSVFKKLGIMKHFHDGTLPEEAVAQVKSEAVVDAGVQVAVADSAPVAEAAEVPAAPEAAEVPAAPEAAEAVEAVEAAPDTETQPE
jgi:small subunit ribosomal protein S16